MYLINEVGQQDFSTAERKMPHKKKIKFAKANANANISASTADDANDDSR